MPQVTIKTGIKRSDGQEEQITEYICDSPACGNIAAHVLGFIKEIGICIALCDEHAAKLRSRP
jgi:hypothetical protein